MIQSETEQTEENSTTNVGMSKINQYLARIKKRQQETLANKCNLYGFNFMTEKPMAANEVVEVPTESSPTDCKSSYAGLSKPINKKESTIDAQ